MRVVLHRIGSSVLRGVAVRSAIAVATAAAVACSSSPSSSPAPAVAWQTPQTSGVSGSPSVCDLDHDGRPEAIVPISAQVPVPGYVVVLDGATGKERWRTAEPANYFPAPYCVDVNADGVDDVLVSKTTGDKVHVTARDLLALDGSTGAVLWSFEANNPSVLAGNVYSVVSESKDADVLFVTDGGDQYAENDPNVGRTPGHVIAFDRGGRMLARWSEPDAREVYSSGVVTRRRDGVLIVAVGTGGETTDGALYLLSYDAAGARFDVAARVASSCPVGGFVASPVAGDVTGDGEMEFVAADYCGVTTVVDARGETVWSSPPADPPFALANPVLADLDADGKLDVAVAYSGFDPPHEAQTIQVADSLVVALRGTDGRPLWRSPVHGIVTGSPATADIDHDGVEDVLVLSWRLPTWRPKGEAPPPASHPATGHSIWLSGRDGHVLVDDPTGNMWGSPLVGDLDRDGSLDVLFTDLSFASQQGTVALMNFPGVAFTATASYSGFRGATHDGCRRTVK